MARNAGVQRSPPVLSPSRAQATCRRLTHRISSPPIRLTECCRHDGKPLGIQLVELFGAKPACWRPSLLGRRTRRRRHRSRIGQRRNIRLRIRVAGKRRANWPRRFFRSLLDGRHMRLRRLGRTWRYRDWRRIGKRGRRVLSGIAMIAKRWLRGASSGRTFDKRAPDGCLVANRAAFSRANSTGNRVRRSSELRPVTTLLSRSAFAHRSRSP